MGALQEQNLAGQSHPRTPTLGTGPAPNLGLSFPVWGSGRWAALTLGLGDRNTARASDLLPVPTCTALSIRVSGSKPWGVPRKKGIASNSHPNSKKKKKKAFQAPL